uniref:Uncharacterized protein n=2 Tax=Panagrolaimus sp. JU765 TaxID=591449 RepID=A0AC34QSB8_9BILA
MTVLTFGCVNCFKKPRNENLVKSKKRHVNVHVPIHVQKNPVNTKNDCTAVKVVKENGQELVVGDRRLSIYEPSISNKYSATTLFEGREIDEFITAVSRKNDLIAFTNETGTRIYDLKVKKSLVLVQTLRTPEPYFSSRFPPVHSWFDENTLAIGWASSVVVCKVKTPKVDDNLTKNGQMKKIFGINSIFLMLASPRTLNEFIGADSIYYLVGQKKLIETKLDLVDDRIQRFVSNEYYKEASNCAIAHKDDLVETVAEVGRKIIENVVQKIDFETAASYLSIICGKHKEEWEYYVQLFEKYGQVLKLVPYLPQKQPQLEPECYESVLTSALYCKSELFLKLIILLPSDLYTRMLVFERECDKPDVIVKKNDDIVEENQAEVEPESFWFFYVMTGEFILGCYW